MQTFLLDHAWVIVLIILWTVPWKAVALWRSARRGHMGWFLTLLLLNTLAILDIVYIFIFSGPEKKKEQEVETQQSGTQNRNSFFIDQRRNSSANPQSRNPIV